MALTTIAAIRDRVRTLITEIDPVSLTGTRFRGWTHEGAGAFREAMEANPAGAFRRFSVRNVGAEDVPEVTNIDYREQMLTLEIVVAYPQDHRAGRDNALDRDDIIESDWGEIDMNVGLCSRGNFGSTYDCTPLGATKEVERGTACDFLVIRAQYLFKRALSIGGLVSGLGAGLGG